MQKTSIPKLPAGVELSDVFHLAADKYLAVDYQNWQEDGNVCQYSCAAIGRALEDILGCRGERFDFLMDFVIHPGLVTLGLDPFSGALYGDLEDDYTNPTFRSQAARYSWLKFCAVLAEEQEAAGASWN